MTTQKHTPGPWEAEVHELSTGPGAVVYGPNGMRIGTDYLSEADARLIAAAPDLLAAAKIGLAALVLSGDTIHAGQVQAAIAKATTA